MLNLKLPTDPRWVNIVEKNIQEILTDHAYCEQKAASNAITIMVRYPDYPEIVLKMSELAREELEHFEQVVHKIQARNLELGRERKDPYVNDLLEFTIKSGDRHEVMVDRLLFAAMVEARSCERFKVLSENINDPDLAAFYHDLMISEAGHYTLFIGLARKYGGKVDVDARWKAFLEYEAEVIQRYGKSDTVHG
jgi:tRNA-(ms[2]io[6]A)-hydroxylase